MTSEDTHYLESASPDELWRWARWFQREICEIEWFHAQGYSLGWRTRFLSHANSGLAVIEDRLGEPQPRNVLADIHKTWEPEFARIEQICRMKGVNDPLELNEIDYMELFHGDCSYSSPENDQTPVEEWSNSDVGQEWR